MQARMLPGWTPIREAKGLGLSGERLKYFHALRSMNAPGSQLKRILVPAGRRSLKTEIAKRAMVLELLRPKPWPNPRYGAFAPTTDQARRVQWEPLLQLIPKEWILKKNESKMLLKTIMGSELHVLGLDKAARVEGVPWDGMWITERADIKPGILGANILPALLGRDGWLIEEGTPDFAKASNGEYFEDYEKAMSGSRPYMRAFTWSSKEVVSQTELERLKGQMDEILIQQELEGKFVRTPDLAYYAYSPAVHVTDAAVYQPTTEKLLGPMVWIGCDFNHAYHNWEMWHVLRDERGRVSTIDVFDELAELNADVFRMCTVLQDRLLAANHPHRMETRDDKPFPIFTNLLFTGDYAGNQKRAEATDTAWLTIKRFFPEAEFNVPNQPPISDRLNAVNRYLKDATGKITLRIHPKCVELQKDFQSVTRKQLYTESQKGGARTHASDAIGYGLRVLARAEDRASS